VDTQLSLLSYAEKSKDATVSDSLTLHIIPAKEIERSEMLIKDGKILSYLLDNPVPPFDQWQVQMSLNKFIGADGELLTIPYDAITLEIIERIKPRILVFGGFWVGMHEIRKGSLKNIYKLLRKTDIPTLAICGGHQMIEFAFNHVDEPTNQYMFGSPINKMHYLQVDEKQDPLFANIDYTEDGYLYVHCAHSCEMKKIPSQFKLLASNNHCAHEIIRDTSRPLFYGVQFHPELANNIYGAGFTVLKNFVGLSERYWGLRTKMDNLGINKQKQTALLQEIFHESETVIDSEGELTILQHAMLVQQGI